MRLSYLSVCVCVCVLVKRKEAKLSKLSLADNKETTQGPRGAQRSSRQANQCSFIVRWSSRNTNMYCGHTWPQDCTGWISPNELPGNHKSDTGVLSQQCKHKEKHAIYCSIFCFCPNISLLLDTWLLRAGSSFSVLKADGRLYHSVVSTRWKARTSGFLLLKIISSFCRRWGNGWVGQRSSRDPKL